jgi:hypothetical protein
VWEFKVLDLTALTSAICISVSHQSLEIIISLNFKIKTKTSIKVSAIQECLKHASLNIYRSVLHKIRKQ